MKCWQWYEAATRFERAELIKLLCKHFGYRRVNQEGSHVFSKRAIPTSIGFPFPTMLRCGSEP
jgi:hypothetical protein